jgi:hypothetical protein
LTAYLKRVGSLIRRPQRDCLELAPSSSCAGLETEEAGCGKLIAILGTEIDGCGIEFVEFCVGCSARTYKWFKRRRFSTLFCLSISARRFRAKAACSLISFA